MAGLLLMLMGLLLPDIRRWSLRVEVFRCAIIVAGAVILVMEVGHWLSKM